MESVKGGGARKRGTEGSVIKGLPWRAGPQTQGPGRCR